MARSASPDSANSQFFIMLMPNLGLDGNYTPVGRVISGMQYVDAIEKGEPPLNPTRIVKASLTEAPAMQTGATSPIVQPRTAAEQAELDRQAREAMQQAIINTEQDKAGKQ
jgi:cyclophilin family peptidyl-prolyl cis-trans isomerase